MSVSATYDAPLAVFQIHGGLNAESGDVTKALERMDDALAKVSSFDRIAKCLADRNQR